MSFHPVDANVLRAGQHLINSELALAQVAAHKAVLTAAQHAVLL